MILRLDFAIVLLLCGAQFACPAERKQLLLIGQKRDNHPPTTHEFMAGLRVLAHCLEPRQDVAVRVLETADPWPEGPDLIRRADCVVLYLSEGAKWLAADPRRHDALAQLAARGGGLVALHWALGCKDPQYVEPFVRLFGACHGGPDRRYQVLETRLQVADRAHPIARGLVPFTIRDEFYYRLKTQAAEPAPRALVTATIDGQEEMICWTWERPDGGRSFGFSGLHFHENYRDASYRRLVTQGVLWTSKLDIPDGGANVDVDDDALKLE